MKYTGRYHSHVEEFDADHYLTSKVGELQEILKEVDNHVELDKENRLSVRLALLDELNQELQTKT